MTAPTTTLSDVEHVYGKAGTMPLRPFGALVTAADEGESIRFGLPFPMGVCPAGKSVQIISPRGTSVPIIQTVLLHWPDGSARSIAITMPRAAFDKGNTVVVGTRGNVLSTWIKIAYEMPLTAEWYVWAGVLPKTHVIPPTSGAISTEVKASLKTAPIATVLDSSTVFFGSSYVRSFNDAPASDVEKWLYDVPSSLFAVAARTAPSWFAAAAMRTADLYNGRIWRKGEGTDRVVGMLKDKVTKPDEWPGGNGAMYSYLEPIFWQALVLGKAPDMALVNDLYQARLQNEPMKYFASLPQWTERHVAFRLLAEVVMAEISFDTSNLQQAVDDLFASPNFKELFWHTAHQNADDGKGDAIASPWMTAILVHVLVRASAFVKLPAGAMMAIGTGLAKSVKWRDPSMLPFDSKAATAPYLVAIDYKDDTANTDDTAHAMEICSAILWCMTFTLPGSPFEGMKATAGALLSTVRKEVDHWIRPNSQPPLEEYRVTPIRKYAWQHHWSHSMAELVRELGVKEEGAPAPGPTPVPTPPPDPVPVPVPPPVVTPPPGPVVTPPVPPTTESRKLKDVGVTGANFEEWSIKGWFAVQGAIVTPGEGAGGTTGIRIRSTTWAQGITSQMIEPVAEEGVLWVGATVRHVAGDTTSPIVQLVINGSTYVHAALPGPIDSRWQTLMVKVPVRAKEDIIIRIISNSGKPQTFDVDNVTAAVYDR